MSSVKERTAAILVVASLAVGGGAGWQLSHSIGGNDKASSVCHEAARLSDGLIGVQAEMIQLATDALNNGGSSNSQLLRAVKVATAHDTLRPATEKALSDCLKGQNNVKVVP